jgi:hypothetical protein
MIDESKIAKLVEQELQKILAGGSVAPAQASNTPVPSSGKTILVIYTGTDIGLNESVEQIEQLRAKGFGFNLVLCPNCKNNPGTNKFVELTGISSIVPDTDGEGIIRLLNAHVGIMVGTLSRNTALKLSYGITDSFILYLIFLALVSKKAVVAAKNGVDPAEGEFAKWNLPSLPSDLMASIITQLQKLERWGMRLVDVKQLAIETDKAIKMATGTIEKVDEMTPFGMDRELITEREVTLAAKSGAKKIILKPGSLITPLARDTAKQLDIIIE